MIKVVKINPFVIETIDCALEHAQDAEKFKAYQLSISLICADLEALKEYVEELDLDQ